MLFEWGKIIRLIDDEFSMVMIARDGLRIVAHTRTSGIIAIFRSVDGGLIDIK